MVTKNVVTGLVESPFQLLQFYEYINVNKVESYSLIVRLNGNKTNDDQIMSTLKSLKMDHDKCSFLIGRVLVIIQLLVKYRLVGKIVIGDDNSAIYKVLNLIIPNNRFVFLDDGAASLESYVKGERFTIFEQVDGVKNKLLNIHKIVNDSLNSDSPKRVVILGSKLTEFGICTKETYFKIIELIVVEIREKYEDDMIISYIPHRGEVEYKEMLTAEYCHTNNIEVMKNKLPVELFSLEMRAEIVGIFGLFSTALFSMQLIYREVTTNYYVISDKDILLHLDGIKMVYSAMESSNMLRNNLPMINDGE